MFHVELRHFPHNACAFNLDERELQAILEPWTRQQVVELGERRWSPHQARLTVLEGPELGLGELSMGRGWRTAERRSRDVTERVLAAAAAAEHETPSPAAGGEAPAAQTQTPDVAGAAPAGGGDALMLGAQIATLLGAEPLRLLEAWRRAAASSPDLSPSETLALAERALAEPPQT